MTELMPWHKNWLVNIEYDRVDFVKEGANSQAFIKLMKSKGGTPMELEQILKAIKPEHAAVISKALADKDAVVKAAETAKKKAEDDMKDMKDNMAKAKTATPEQTQEEILKSVSDPAVKAFLETQIAKAKAAEELVMKAREEKLDVEAIAKAKEVPNVGAEEAVLVDVYKKLKGVDEKLCEDVFGIFKAASALAGTSAAFTETGAGGGTGGGDFSGDESSAWAAIEKAAEPIAKDRNISKSRAISAVIKENPGLYENYLKAQQG